MSKDSKSPTSEKVSCPCIRNGQPGNRELSFVWQDQGDGRPRLYVFGDWSSKRGDWRSKDHYEVQETPSPLGRAFLLHRSVQAIAEDPEGDHYYGVLIANEQDTTCECRGFQAHGHCKHIAGIRWALSVGHLDKAPAPAPRRFVPPSIPIAGDVALVEVTEGEELAWVLCAHHLGTGRRFVVSVVGTTDGDEAMSKCREALAEVDVLGGDWQISVEAMEIDRVIACQHEWADEEERRLLNDPAYLLDSDLELLEDPDSPIPFELSNNRPADPVSCPF